MQMMSALAQSTRFTLSSADRVLRVTAGGALTFRLISNVAPPTASLLEQKLPLKPAGLTDAYGDNGVGTRAAHGS